MATKIKVIVAGILLLLTSIYFYFTIRFKFIEREYIAGLVAITNDIVLSYNTAEIRISENNKIPASDHLTEFLKSVHAKYKDIALLAVTDRGLTVRVSSKNDRFIRSADLFEEILKDFTGERFNISKNSPYVIRYYDERTAIGVAQHKFYIFLSKIGQYRLLTVYPYHFGKRILIRTGLELSLIVVFFIIFTVLARVVFAKRRAISREPGKDGAGEKHGSVSMDEDTVTAPVRAANVMPDVMSGAIFDLLSTIRRFYAADTSLLYLCRSSGMLEKTAELTGDTFYRPGSVSVDPIDINNEAGVELRKSSLLVMDDGRKIILPLVYNNIFLGTVNVTRRHPFRGDEIRDIRSGIKDIFLRDAYDYIISREEINWED
jgi:hypothetical protein